MKLNSAQLEAFTQLAESQTFTAAARKLHITQPALSHRISKLEEEMRTTLLIRESQGVVLTPAGEKLLRYCHQQRQLEAEVIKAVSGETNTLAGSVSIGAYSSILRSVIVPRLAAFQRKHEAVQLNFISAEMKDLPQHLLSGKADFILLDYEWNRLGVQKVKVGEEIYRVYESSKYQTPPHRYLDHHVDDRMAELYFSATALKHEVKERQFMGTGYDVLEGCAHGFGRAILPEHLAVNDSRLRAVQTFKPKTYPIYLYYPIQLFSPQLHSRVIDCLAQESKR